jgi:hypothetical protein
VPAIEPLRHVRQQRRERCRAASADQDALRPRVAAEVRRECGRGVARAEQGRADDDRNDDAETVGQAPHQDAAHAEADHRQRVGKRSRAARGTEVYLYRGQCHHHRPHADAADCRQHEARYQARPRVERFDCVQRGHRAKLIVRGVCIERRQENR